MSNQKLGLPVRTEGDSDFKLQTKVVDSLLPSQQMQVDANRNAHVKVHGKDPANADKILKLSQAGDVTPDGVYDGTNNTDPANVGLVAMQANASPADNQQTLRLTAVPNGAGTRRALDMAMLDENGEPFTRLNPVPMELVESTGDEIVNPDKAVAVPVDGTDDHEYTVTALKTLLVDHINIAASARAEYEVFVEDGVATNSFDYVDIGFTSVARQSAKIDFAKRLKVAAGVRLRITRKNTDNQAQDLHTTIVGVEV